MSRPVLICMLVCASCSSEDKPDARLVPLPPVPDGRPADAGLADGPRTDGPIAVDGPPAVVDAAPPDTNAPPGPDGPPQLAAVVLSELSPNQPSGHDLVELLVTAGGTTAGIQIEAGYKNPTVLAALPDLQVEAGDLVVVHLTPAGTTAAAETTAKDQQKTADNFDGAWDVLGAAAELPYADVVVTVRGADGKLRSAVPFFRSDLVDPDQFRLFPADLQAAIDDGLWKEACAPSPCSASSDFGGVAIDWLGAGTGRDPAQASGATVARKPAAAADKKADWQGIPAAAPFNTLGMTN